jgi:diguanylate cyclase (GGDEF)-like protein
MVIAAVDRLTGLLDRRAFMEAVEERVRADEVVTVGALDIDQFKTLNDSCGHAAGDQVLAAVARHLAELAERNEGMAGRVGGDEFAIALPGKTLEQGFLAFEQLRRDVAADTAVLPQEAKGFRLTISIGAANYPRDVKNAADLLSRADQALWQAKEGGRDQVALPAPEEMVLKSNYYTTAQLGRLKRLAESAKKKESVLLREALDDLFRKYDV